MIKRSPNPRKSLSQIRANLPSLLLPTKNQPEPHPNPPDPQIRDYPSLTITAGLPTTDNPDARGEAPVHLHPIPTKVFALTAAHLDPRINEDGATISYQETEAILPMDMGIDREISDDPEASLICVLAVIRSQGNMALDPPPLLPPPPDPGGNFINVEAGNASPHQTAPSFPSSRVRITMEPGKLIGSQAADAASAGSAGGTGAASATPPTSAWVGAQTLGLAPPGGLLGSKLWRMTARRRNARPSSST